MQNYVRGLVAASLLGLGSTAGAATVDLGTVAPGGFVGGALIFPSSVVIDDTWTFTIDSPLTTAISFDSNDSIPFFEISSYSVSSGDLGPFSYVAADNAWKFDGPLAAGTYTIDVTGEVTGDFAGQYNVLIGTSPIPVPAAAWLFGSALLGLVAVKRKTA